MSTRNRPSKIPRRLWDAAVLLAVIGLALVTAAALLRYLEGV